MNKFLLLIILCFGILISASCSSTEEPTSSNTITGIVWQWERVIVQPDSVTTTVPNPENYTIVFNEDGTLTGQADCNSFGGTYAQESGFVITLGPATMAYCGEDSLDQQYLDLLSQVVAGGPDGAGGLALENAGGQTRMEFSNGGTAS